MTTQPLVLHARDGTHWTILGHATGQNHHVCAQGHDHGQMTSNRHSAAAAAAEGARSVHLCCLSLLLPSVCCSSFVHDHALVHEHDVFGPQCVQTQVGGHHLWHVALEGGWPHPQKTSVSFAFI